MFKRGQILLHTEKNFLIALSAPNGMEYFRSTDVTVIEYSKATGELPIREILGGDIYSSFQYYVPTISVYVCTGMLSFSLINFSRKRFS